MSPLIRRATIGNTWFWVLSGFAISLITAGFLVPPMGIIDGSVLTVHALNTEFAEGTPGSGLNLRLMDMERRLTGAAEQEVEA